jgi:hypothetical protein
MPKIPRGKSLYHQETRSSGGPNRGVFTSGLNLKLSTQAVVVLCAGYSLEVRQS